MNARFQARTLVRLVGAIIVASIAATILVEPRAEATDGYGVSAVALADASLPPNEGALPSRRLTRAEPSARVNSRFRAVRAALFACACLLAGSESPAQVAPTPAEIATASPLHAAAAQGDTAGIARLITGGQNPNSRDGRERTPLHVAAFARRRDAMRLLVEGGADPRAMEGQAYDAITIAAVADDLETMKTAITVGGDPRAVTSPYDGTALIAAAHLGHAAIVRELIRAGAPLDHVNNLGWTALIEAVVLGDGGPRHVETVRALVSAGARRDLADRSGATPLDLARQRGYREIVALLE